MLRLFTEHPASVGESYFEHLKFASRTGATMVVGGCACFVHGLMPFLCTTTGSRTIRALAARLGGAQRRQGTELRLVRVSREQAWSRSEGLDRPAVIESLNSSAL
ncbi:MAG TPA: DUF6356 family protein [Aliidongia sp.]|uniref:DUF6356 family protein n=1 Tax=Aliidongia sp. TaxID=1914230 RepID=UPI002DDD0A7B|nr:DUF6356 family protein [Aliidongia sp.]HEV2676264.1 DUF6356 family protein [Aliidongia sp.]